MLIIEDGQSESINSLERIIFLDILLILVWYNI